MQLNRSPWDFNVNLSCDIPKGSVEKSKSEKSGCQFFFAVLVTL